MNKTPVSELDYELPIESIAQEPYKNPEDSKLLDASTKEIYKFSEINKIKSIPTVNIHSYNKYEENFIKMQSSPDQFSWEIITKNL